MVSRTGHVIVANRPIGTTEPPPLSQRLAAAIACLRPCTSHKGRSKLESNRLFGTRPACLPVHSKYRARKTNLVSNGSAMKKGGLLEWWPEWRGRRFFFSAFSAHAVSHFAYPFRKWQVLTAKRCSCLREFEEAARICLCIGLCCGTNVCFWPLRWVLV